MHAVATKHQGSTQAREKQDTSMFLLRHIFEALFRPGPASAVPSDRATESAFISIMNALKKD